LKHSGYIDNRYVVLYCLILSIIFVT